jgi:hypothetical protein
MDPGHAVERAGGLVSETVAFVICGQCVIVVVGTYMYVAVNSV